MSTMNDALPHELLFEPDGHLTEAALTLAADGELDRLHALHVRAHDHLDDCESCGERLGHAALFAVLAGDALRERPLAMPLATTAPARALPVAAPLSGGAASSGVRKRRPFPMPAIAAALALVALTAGPAVIDAIQGIPGVIAALPFLVRVASAFVRAPWVVGSTALLFKGVSALLLAAIGLQVARTTSRSASWQQGGV